MGQFGKILKFELKNYFTNKVFVGVTVFLAVAIAVVMFFPRIMEGFQKEEGSTVTDTSRPVMLIAGENAEAVSQAFSEAFTNYEVKMADGNMEAVKEQIIAGEVECAFVMESLTAYTYYVNNLSMYDSNTVIADEVLQSIYRMSAMIEGGISAEEAGAILSVQMEHETMKLGKDQMENFFYTYIMIFALYMVILLYGQMVATNVATEKSSRAMEVLITSAKPASMMFGKVLASCLAGFIQLVVVFGTALICYNFNKAYLDETGVIASMFNMPIDLFVYMLIFFVLGFLIYAFMFGAVGSTASKLEDINTSVMPITMLFVVGFMVVMFSMTAGNVDTILMKVCSFIPFTSPMAMFTRIAMTTVPFYEIVISIILLIASVIGIGLLSAKIYRVGVLLYGTPPKLGAIIKAIRKA
ncbi:MAG: ABC transporter permease [Lachnospiraceae bacterium]|nr:ABC transporter permease [Lachnospiraceae bacterium]